MSLAESGNHIELCDCQGQQGFHAFTKDHWGQGQIESAFTEILSSHLVESHIVI